jgi:AraC-like DNA-binding protein
MMLSSIPGSGMCAERSAPSVSLDSLELLLHDLREEQRPDLLIRISQSLEDKNLIKAFDCSQSALNIALQLDNTKEILECNLQIARIRILQDSLNEARDFLKKIISYPEEISENDTVYDDFKLIKAKAEFLNALLCFYNSPDSVKKAILNVQNALFYLKNNNERLYLAYSYLMLGNLYFYLELYQQGLDFYEKSLSIINLHNFGQNKHLFFHKLFCLLNENPKPHSTSLSCHISPSHTKTDLITSLYIKLGHANSRICAYTKAKDYFDKAAEIAVLTHNFDAQICILSKIGSMYLEMEDYAKAKDFFERALEISTKRKSEVLMYSNAIQLARLYRQTKDFCRALDYLKVADTFGASPVPFNLKLAYTLEKGKIFFEQGNYGEAVACFKQYYDSCLAINAIPYLYELSYQIYRAQDSMGNYQDAILSYKQCRRFNDTLRAMDDKILLNVTELNLDIDRVESEMDILEKNMILKNIEVKRKRIIAVSSATGFTVMIIFTILIFLIHRRKRNAYDQLMEKNLAIIKEHSKQLSTKNKITESNSLDTQKSNDLLTRLNKLVDDQKIFLDPNISLKKLANKLNTNSTYLSRLINHNYQTNFTGFINEYRIKEAQKLMTEKTGQYLSIEGIAMKVGFRSKSVFNPAFKKHTGVTPSYYMNYIREVKTKK